MADGRNYQRKGDSFSDLVQRGEGPRTVRCRQNQSTGRVYFTRVTVEMCAALKVATVAAALRDTAASAGRFKGQSAGQLAALLALDWNTGSAEAQLGPADQPPRLPGGRRIRFTVTPTGARGERLWLLCPDCGRRCAAVYVSPWQATGQRIDGLTLLGCRVCLGLTDHSRQRHKTLDWAGALLGWQTEPYNRRRGTRSAARADHVLRQATARAGL